MKFRIALLAGLFVASIGGIAAPTTASAEVGIYLSIPPPPSRFERVPPPRRGYVWAPGYWNARNNRHTWQRGHWERQRRGHHYNQPTWTQRDNRWQLERGRWNKGDRDGDGVRNSRDSAPDNPRRN